MSDPAFRLQALRYGNKAIARIIDRLVEECVTLPIGSPDRQDRIILIAELEQRRRRAQADDPAALEALLKERGFATPTNGSLQEPTRAEIEGHDWEVAEARDRKLRERGEKDRARRAAILKAMARRVGVTWRSDE